MSATQSGSNYIRKAARHLRWASLADQLMKNAGQAADLPEAEHQFFHVLTHVNVAFEALADASKEVDAGTLRATMLNDRRLDPLLHYYWKARVADTHGALLEWTLAFENMEFTVLDARRANRFRTGAETEHQLLQRLVCRLYGVLTMDGVRALIKAGHRPTLEDELRVGIRMNFSRKSISLSDFSYLDKNGSEVLVPSPNSHLGQQIPNAADVTAEMVIAYYGKMLTDLSSGMAL